MSASEHLIRDLAYRLWEAAGRPEGRADEFWFAAQQEFLGEGRSPDLPLGALEPPAEEPPLVAALHGVPTGQPGERISEQGVLDDALEGLAVPAPSGRAGRAT